MSFTEKPANAGEFFSMGPLGVFDGAVAINYLLIICDTLSHAMKVPKNTHFSWSDNSLNKNKLQVACSLQIHWLRNGRESNPIIRRLGLVHYICAHAHE